MWATACVLVTFLASIVRCDFPNCLKGPLARNGVCNTNLTAPERAKALISAFTIEEKIGNLINTAPGVPRLGLPPYEWWSEALHGIADCPGVHFAKEGEFSYATSFPMPINLGAAFDDRGVYQMGQRIALEGRAFNNANRSGLDFWTPNINPFRDPRWGRGSETPGEDVYHISQYIKNLLSGMSYREKGNPHFPILATCKHFAAYDVEGTPNLDETSRFNFDAKVTMQELSEFYLTPFKACVDADVAAIMCSYNSINGVPACANEFLLQKVLREHWGWSQETKWVTSDCQAVQMIREGHNYTRSKPEAAALALKSGTDLECGTYYDARFAYYDTLGTALNQSLVSVGNIDKALTRLYSSLVTVGYFDTPSNQSVQPQRLRQVGWKDISVTQDDLAYKLAAESIVLVKNDGILPLSASKSIAFVGPWANATTQMQGNYAGIAPHLWTIKLAAEAAGLKVAYAYGTNISTPHDSEFDAFAIARSCDVVVYAGGIDLTVEAEGKDRKDIAWPAAQLSLLRRLKAEGKPIVIVQMGSPVDSTEFLQGNSSVNAFLWAGYPGQEGGRAVIDVLLGGQPPSGRMPVTVYPASYAEQVPIEDMNLRPVASNKNLGRTHVWYTGKPVVPFGHGLSYTNWSYALKNNSRSNQLLSGSKSISIQDLLSTQSSSRIKSATQLLESHVERVTALVTNTGSRNSSHVVQAFLTAKVGPAPYPNQRLVGYKRTIVLGPGDTEEFDFNLSVGEFARTEQDGSRVVYPGNYTVWLGVDRLLSYNLTLLGSPEVVDRFPQP